MSQFPHGSPPVPARPPRTAQLRLLLRLTPVSLGVNLADTVVQALAGPLTLLPGTEDVLRVPWLPGGGPAAVLALYGVVLTTGLYALVWFPLREQMQWGWILGLVFCSLAVLGDVVDLAVLSLGGDVLPALSTAALVAVNVLWLVVAGRPGVRAALR